MNIRYNITRILLNENNRIAHEWFQVGAHCKWSELKETKEQRLYKQYEQQALDYSQQIAYEQGRILI